MKRIAVLCLILVVGSAIALHSAGGIQGAYSSVRSALLGEDPGEAMAAMARISRERSEAISALITITGKHDVDNSWNGVRHRAILLLGEMRAMEAVGPLSNNLAFVPTGTIVTYEALPREAYYPAALALSQIGTPAVKRMLGLISTSRDEQTRNLAAWVVLEAEGKEVAEFRLQKELEKSFRNSKPRVEAALKFIQNYKPVFGPPDKKDLHTYRTLPSEPAKPAK